MRTATEWLRRAAAASVPLCATSTASEGRGSVTTTSTSLSEGRGCAAADPPASRAKLAARASASGIRERRKRAAWYARPGRLAMTRSGYTDRPRGCGGIGRRARFRSVWASARGGSSPLIRIAFSDTCHCRIGAGGSDSLRHHSTPKWISLCHAAAPECKHHERQLLRLVLEGASCAEGPHRTSPRACAARPASIPDRLDPEHPDERRLGLLVNVDNAC